MMLNTLPLLLLIAASEASVIVRTGNTPEHYTICGGDRGWTEKDSLDAAKYLADVVVTSDAFFMAKEDCVYAHVNTTVVSLCNGIYRDRTINRDEVRRGTEQLVKDCGLAGGFTGIHVVNNLTFASYGVGGVAIELPGGNNPPDTPGSRKRSKRQSVPDDPKALTCPPTYNGVPSYDCPKVNNLNEDGSCGGEISASKNRCQTYCETKRTKFIGVEQKVPGRAGDANPRGASLPEVTEGTEISISNGFSIGAEGIVKEVIGAGVSYQWSITKTTTKSTTQKNEAVSTEYYSRWVVFPKLVETCGSVSRKKYSPPLPCQYPGCANPPATCSGDLETIGNVCSLSPVLNDEGQGELYYAVRYENKDGVPAPMDKQHPTYQSLCDSPDPDHDGEQECYNTMPSFKMGRNFKEEEEYYNRLG